MSAAEVITTLADAGVTLYLDGGTLRCRAKQGAYTPELRALVDRHRAEVMATLAGAPVAIALANLLAKNGESWQGTATDLHADLDALLDDAGRRVFPRTPKALSEAVKRLAPNLRAKGIEATQERAHGGVRVWRIEKVHSAAPTKEGKPASPASPNPGIWHQESIQAVTQRVTQGDARGVHGDARPADGDARVTHHVDPFVTANTKTVSQSPGSGDAGDARLPPLVAPVQVVVSPAGDDLEDEIA